MACAGRLAIAQLSVTLARLTPFPEPDQRLNGERPDNGRDMTYDRA